MAASFLNGDHFFSGDIIIQGYSYSAPGQVADPNTYTNRAYKHCGAGVFGRFSALDISQILIDSTVYGWLGWLATDVNVGIMHIDTPVLDALVQLYSGSTKQGFTISTLMTRSLGSATNYDVPTDIAARATTVIRSGILGNDIRFNIGNLQVGQIIASSSNKYASVVKSAGPGLKVHIAVVEDWEGGATTFLDTGNGYSGEVIAKYANGAVARLRQADFNVTTDQVMPFICTRRIVRRITVANGQPNGLSLGTAAGGIYTAVAKGGAAVVSAAQVYSGITSEAAFVDLTLAATLTTTARGDLVWYLSLTTPEGAAENADIYVFADIIEQP
jgi:hypothetical protein